MSGIVVKCIDKRFWLMVPCLLIISQVGLFAQGDISAGQNIDTPFNVNEIIESVSHYQMRNNPAAQHVGNTVDLRPAKKSEPSRDGEFLIDTTITYIPAPGDQAYPVVAFDGVNYLVVWCYGEDIYGSRVTPDGIILDTNWIAVSSATNYQGSPSIAFDGTNYLVVWSDHRDGSWDIYGARVTTGGVVLDTNGIAISTVYYHKDYPSVAFDGTNYLVVWRDGPDPRDIYGTRVTTGGVVLDTAGIAICTIIGEQRYPMLAFDGANYLVVWEDWRNGYPDIYGARVTPEGVVLDLNGIAICTVAVHQLDPSVAFDGTNYLVVWTDLRLGPAVVDIYGARVTTHGVVLDTAGIAICTGIRASRTALAFSGTNYLVTWQDNRNDPHISDIYGARVTTGGVVLDPNGFAISTAPNAQYTPSVAFDGTNCLVVWEDSRNNVYESDIYGARITTGNVVLDTAGILLCTAPNPQYSPSAAFDGTNYLIVWEDFRNSNSPSKGIYGARVTPTGVLLDPGGIAITNNPVWQSYPSVAFGGTNYLVTWQDNRNGSDIYGARVTTSGVVLDPNGIIISSGNLAEWPSVTFDGTNYLVVWSYSRSDIYGARVTNDGVVLDPEGFGISPNDTCMDLFPKVAFDGLYYLVVWTAFPRESRDYEPGIYGARVTPTGRVIDPGGIAIHIPQNYYIDSPSLAYGGTNYLVTWQDGRNGALDIYGARVTTGGVVLDTTGIAICTAVDNQWRPSIVFDGTNYLIVWEDSRNGYPRDIYGAKVTPSGIVMDSFAFSTQSGDQITPSLASGSGGQVLCTYSGFTDSINAHAVNTMRIWGKFYPLVGIKEGEGTTISRTYFGPTIFRGPLVLPKGKSCRVFDIMGRVVEPKRLQPGIYFIEIDNKIVQKLIKVK